jgi:ATP synthase protein I
VGDAPGRVDAVNDHQRLKARVEQQAERMKRAEHDRQTLLAQTVYLGTLGLVLVLPIIVGAYLGDWLDSRLPGFSVNWTTSLIIVGVFVGAINAWLLIKGRQ